MLTTLKDKIIFVYSFIGIVTVIFAALLFNLINRHAVNVLFWDEWDFNVSLFAHPTAWEMFTFQHGPHRQGIGLFVSNLIGYVSNWNMRTEAFAIGAILVLATVAALYLKYRLFGNLTFWDALISVICLNFTQCEIAFPNTNPAYTALPLLLIMLSGISLTLKNPAARYLLLAAINFFTIFTGFGVFLGVVVPVVLVLAIVVHGLNKEWRALLFASGALLIALLSLVIFFTDYRFMPAVDCFQFPHPQPFEYLVFVSNMLTSGIGFYSGYKASFAKSFGMFLFAIWLITLFYQFWLIIKTRSLSPTLLVIFSFISFSAIYAVNTAVGRVCLGTFTAQSPRYITLLIPGWLALYFAVLLWKSDILRIGMLAIFTVFFGLMPLRHYNQINTNFAPLTAARQTWATCYVETENIDECDQLAKQKVYPNAQATHLQEKLDFLKQHRYNLFSNR